jgi:hypothetical protein
VEVKAPTKPAGRSGAEEQRADGAARKGTSPEWLIGDSRPVRNGDVRIIEGDQDNIKITTPLDYELAKIIAEGFEK